MKAGVLLLLLLCLLSVKGQAIRFKGNHGMIEGELLSTVKVALPSDCLTRCGDTSECLAYSYNGDTKVCKLGKSGYTVSKFNGASIYYERTTATGGTQSTSTHSGTEPTSCPVRHKNWNLPGKNQNSFPQITTFSSSGANSGTVNKGNLVDGDPTTLYKSNTQNYPRVSIDFKQPFRLTGVSITSGTTPLASLEVRVGNTDILSAPGNSRITANERCNAYMGPSSGLAGEQIYISCRSPRGMLGRYVSLQLHERNVTNMLDSPFEMADLEVFGFKRTCTSQNPL